MGVIKKKQSTKYTVEFKRYSRPSEKPLKRTYKSFKEAQKDYNTVKNNGNCFNIKFYKTEKIYYKH